eukprot:COSAG02_NODE_18588_length_930_cov_2.250301_1_plen_39_part_10
MLRLTEQTALIPSYKAYSLVVLQADTGIAGNLHKKSSDC